MLKTIVTGNLGADAELKEVAGTDVINFSLAHTKKGYAKQDGTVVQDKTTWFDCAIWRRKGLAPYLKKGQSVTVSGEVGTRAWIKNDVAYSGLTLNVDEIELQGGRTEQTAQSQSQPVEQNNNDPLPF